ncbi:MAG TPA: hypothetical protein HA340_01085, partial [Candidatus Thalassarchaeaceae archaeon]|nr:hypothetical protein [Candidatus Thalassarchaeaceae archaeon]
MTGPLYDDVVLLDAPEGPEAAIFALDNGTVMDISSHPYEAVAGTTDDVILIDGEENSLAWVTESSPLIANILTLD